jgi:hypothetical protein
MKSEKTYTTFPGARPLSSRNKPASPVFMEGVYR